MKPPVIAVIVIVLLLPIITLFVTKKHGNANDAYTSSTASPSTQSTNTPAPVTNPADLVDPADVASASQVILKTSMGDITIDLYPADASHTVKNFVTLGKRGYYNGVTFHRVIKDFVIQGGDPTGTGSGGESIYGKQFPDEINSHKIVKGTVAMANAGANTNGSQFYIVTETAQPSLDGHYTVFGQVQDASMSVVQAIAGVPTDSGDKPKTDVRITGFTIVK